MLTLLRVMQAGECGFCTRAAEEAEWLWGGACVVGGKGWEREGPGRWREEEVGEGCGEGE